MLSAQHVSNKLHRRGAEPLTLHWIPKLPLLDMRHRPVRCAYRSALCLKLYRIIDTDTLHMSMCMPHVTLYKWSLILSYRTCLPDG